MNAQELATALLDAPESADRRAILIGQPVETLHESIRLLKDQADKNSLTDPQEAEKQVGLIKEIAEFSQNTHCQALANWAEGNFLIQQGDFPACLQLYQQAEQFYEETGLETETARLATNRAFVLKNLGRYEEGLVAVQKALSILRRQPPSVFLASSLNAQGVLLRLERRYDEALAALGECQAIYATLDMPERQARAMVNQANLLENTEHFSQAIDLLQRARETLAHNGVWLEVARADLNLGITLARLGRYDPALQAFNQAEDRFQELGNEMEANVVRLYRADLYVEFNLIDDLLREAAPGLPIFEDRQMEWQAGRAVLHQAEAWRRRGDWIRANQLATKARTVFDHLPDPLWSMLAGLEQAHVQADACDWSPALEKALEASEFLRSQGMSVRAGQAYILAGRCCLALEHWDQAIVHYRAALEIAEEAQAHSLSFRANYGLGQVAERAGYWLTAYDHYRLAVEKIEIVRQQLSIEDFRAGFLEDKLDIYQALVLVCLHLERQEEAFWFIERAKSGALVELLMAALLQGKAIAGFDPVLLARLRELGQKLNWRYNQLNGDDESRGQAEVRPEVSLWREISALEQEVTHTWRQIQLAHPLFMALEGHKPDFLPRLVEEEVFIQYYIADKEIHAFVVDHFGLQAHKKLPGNLGGLQEALAALNTLMDNAATLAGRDASTSPESLVQQVLSWLYTDLLHPLEPWLKKNGRIYMAPDGPLFDVPFHALFDGQRYLVELNEVVYAPSASALVLCQKARCKRNENNHSAFILGYSNCGQLEHVADEVTAIGKSLPQANVFLDVPDALTTLQAHAGQSAVIHLAAHAIFRRDNPLFSALQLSEQDWLRVLDLYTLQLEGALVTLSACQTGRHGLRGGDLLGFGRGFMCAGAAAQVCTLWLADDFAAASFMKQFYLRLTGGETVAAALRHAQLSLISMKKKSDGNGYSHPFYWAPFYIMGDPELRLV